MSIIRFILYVVYCRSWVNWAASWTVYESRRKQDTKKNYSLHNKLDCTEVLPGLNPVLSGLHQNENLWHVWPDIGHITNGKNSTRSFTHTLMGWKWQANALLCWILTSYTQLQSQWSSDWTGKRQQIKIWVMMHKSIHVCVCVILPSNAHISW